MRFYTKQEGEDMHINEYNFLPTPARTIRIEVFLHEQGFTIEFDEIDEIATHLIIFKDNQPIGTCRIYYNNEVASFVIGRIAILKEWRNLGFGSMIIKAAENVIKLNGSNKVMLSAQYRLKDFYLRLGYTPIGEIYLDENCPHIWMEKSLISTLGNKKSY